MTKKIMTTAKARPESSAADKVMVYLPHQAGARRRRTELTLKQTTAQTEKLRPVCFGLEEWKTEEGETRWNGDGKKTKEDADNVRPGE